MTVTKSSNLGDAQLFNVQNITTWTADSRARAKLDPDKKSRAARDHHVGSRLSTKTQAENRRPNSKHKIQKIAQI
jgi:hypothetical protein